MAIRLFLVLIVLQSSLTGIVEGNKDEKELLDYIFKDYDIRVRPVEEFTSYLNITFFISLIQLIQVDEKQQTVTTRVLRAMFWNDYALKWDAESYGNISQITLPRGQTWLPDIQLYNSASDEQQVESDIKTIVMNDGGIVDVLPMLLKSTCIMDVTWFPFDEQKCPLEFGSWTLSAKFIYMALAMKTAERSLYIDNGEWNLISAIGVERARIDECCPDPYRAIRYIIHIKRRSFYYFFTLLIPCGLIGFLAILGFTLPPESGEKLPLGVTILFSLIVFLNTISESMPANSDALPLIGTYFNCVMVMIALSVVSTIIINLNVSAVNTKGIEGRAKKLFLKWLPWMLFLRPLNTFEQGSFSKKKIINAFASNFNLQGEPITNWESSSEERYKQQWIFAATVVDRLCLIISFAFTLVSVTVFLIFAF